MRKIKSIVFVSILVFLSSCNSDVFEEHELGSNLIDKSTEVFLIDTFTIETSTVKLDSVVTSGYSNVLLGQYKDPYLGNIKSDFYGQVELKTPFTRRTVNGVEVDVKFDSLVFIMYHQPSIEVNTTGGTRINNYFHGDTLQKQSISIHRVTEDFELEDNKIAYNADDVLDYDVAPLGSSIFTPQRYINSVYDEAKDNDPLEEKGGLRIKMDDALGQEIIDSVNTGSDIVEDNVKWLKFLKGVLLKSGDNNTALFTYQTGAKMKMRLYYSETEFTEAGIAKFHDFTVNKKVENFTNYSSDFNSDEYDFIHKLGLISELEDDLASTETNNLAFIQGGTGLITKIRIPYIEELNQLGLTGGILKAELVFSPQKDSYDEDLYPLPFSNFELSTTNKNNKSQGGVVDTRTGNIVTSSYVPNAMHIDESYYTFELTDYVSQILFNGQEYDDALLLSLPQNIIGNSMERLIIDNDQKSDSRMRLKVTYVVQN